MHLNHELFNRNCQGRSNRRGMLAGSVLAMCAASLALWTGCAEPMPPEHVAAVSKMQGLGAKVQFEDGGLRLNMEGSRVEDADLEQLHNIKNLKTLDLRSTRITDKALETVQSLKSLNLVLLTGTAVSPEAIDALQKARPELNITR